jgi:hypothetical protein
MYIDCSICGESFDPRSKEKRMAGGLRNHCVDCAEETVIPYAGIAAGEGKQNSVQVLKFNSAGDRAAYLEYWKVNSGLYKGKSCQIGRGLKSTPNIQFGIRATIEGNANHKGKA